MPVKKSKRQENQKLVEVKITIGHNLDGSRIQKSFYGSTRRAAKVKADAYKADSEKGILVVKNPTFEQWAATWLETYKKGKVKDTSFQYTYANAVKNHLSPYFGKTHLSDIKPAMVQQFFNEKSKTHARDSIKKMRMCLDGIFRTAIENDLCIKNPVTQDLKIQEDEPGDRNDTEKNVYTKRQRDIVLEFAKTHRFGLDITLLLKTGMRRGELCGLRWEDIDFKQGVVYVRNAAIDVKCEASKEWEVRVGRPKTPQSIRPIPIDKQLVKMLQAHPRVIVVGQNIHKKIPGTEVQTEYVFYDKFGKVSSPNNWSHRRYKVFMDDLIEKFPQVPRLNPHELRHTAATLWKDDGVDVFTISKLGGWADLDMIAKRYAHSSVPALKKAMGMAKKRLHLGKALSKMFVHCSYSATSDENSIDLK